MGILYVQHKDLKSHFVNFHLVHLSTKQNDVSWHMKRHFQELDQDSTNNSRTQIKKPIRNPFQEHKLGNPWETHFKNMNRIERQQVIPTD